MKKMNSCRAPHAECGCVDCEDYRLSQVKVGELYRPFRNSRGRTLAEWPPYWRAGKWHEDGWTRRFGGLEVFMVVEFPARSESSNDHHLNPVLCFSTCGEQFVTSAKWIVKV